MPEGTRDYTSSSQGLEEEQPRGAVLLLPRANSCRQTPYLSRNRLHENQDAHPRDRLVIQRSGRSSSRGSNRNRSVEKGGGEVWFSSTRTTSDRRAGSRKERASEAFLLEQEKERKEKSQRDVGKMSLEDGGNPSGSRLQKTHKVEWLQEEEERLVNNFFRQVQQPDKRQQRGARLRPPPQEDLGVTWPGGHRDKQPLLSPRAPGRESGGSVCTDVITARSFTPKCPAKQFCEKCSHCARSWTPSWTGRY